MCAKLLYAMSIQGDLQNYAKISRRPLSVSERTSCTVGSPVWLQRRVWRTTCDVVADVEGSSGSDNINYYYPMHMRKE